MTGEELTWTIFGSIVALLIAAAILGMTLFLTDNSSHISDNNAKRDAKIQIARAHACESASDVTVCLKLNKAN